jgi:hypothetical protein
MQPKSDRLLFSQRVYKGTTFPSPFIKIFNKFVDDKIISVYKKSFSRFVISSTNIEVIEIIAMNTDDFLSLLDHLLVSG